MAEQWLAMTRLVRAACHVAVVVDVARATFFAFESAEGRGGSGKVRG